MQKLVFLLVAVLIVSACVSSVATGQLIIGVKDHPKMIGGIGNVSSIDLTVRSIQVHFSGPDIGDNETDDNETEVEESDEDEILNRSSNWITVFEGSKTFNLLDFTGNAVGILGNVSLSPGRYQQIRLFIESSNITVDSVQYPLRIPSKVLKLVEGFRVIENQTTLIVLDFDVEKSVKREDDGFRLRPTIKIEEFETDEDEEDEIEDETGQELEEIEED